MEQEKTEGRKITFSPRLMEVMFFLEYYLRKTIGLVTVLKGFILAIFFPGMLVDFFYVAAALLFAGSYLLVNTKKSNTWIGRRETGQRTAF